MDRRTFLAAIIKPVAAFYLATRVPLTWEPYSLGPGKIYLASLDGGKPGLYEFVGMVGDLTVAPIVEPV